MKRKVMRKSFVSLTRKIGGRAPLQICCDKLKQVVSILAVMFHIRAKKIRKIRREEFCEIFHFRVKGHGRQRINYAKVESS
jgi:hypothetical protein